MDLNRPRVSLRPHEWAASVARGDLDLTDDERTTREALSTELDRLEQQYVDVDELPEKVDQRLSEIETALEAFDKRPMIYDPVEVARAGVFVSIDNDGDLKIERGYVRPEDEPATQPAEGDDANSPM